MNVKNRQALKEMYGGKCAYCGIVLGDRWHVDHVEPVIRAPENGYSGGKIRLLRPENHRVDNYKPACIPCNINKTSSPLESWRKSLERLPQSLTNQSGQYRHALRFGLIKEHKIPVVFYFEQYEATAPKDKP